MMRAAIAAALASAALLWGASPSVGAGWLVWIALVPAAAVALAAPGRAGRLAVPLAYAVYLELLFVPALPFGLADGLWGDPVVPILVGGSPVLVVALVLIPLLGCALYLADFGRPWPRRRLGRRMEAVVLMLAPALAWAALEVVRVKFDPGGPWGAVYLSQAELGSGSLGRLAGPWLITVAIVAVNYGLALALVRGRAAPALAAAVVAIFAFTGVQAGADEPEDSVVVAAVQPGYHTSEEDRAVLRNFEPGSHDRAALDLIGDLGTLTRQAHARGAELVLWPEATMYVDPRAEPQVRRALLRLAGRAGATLVVPYFLRDARRSEALAVVPPVEGAGRLTGELSPGRAKQRASWFLGERGGGYSAATPLDAGGLRLGLLPGLDAQDPALPARLAGRDAELLLTPTHDWPALAVQQRAAALLAARTVRPPLVRADWRYGSAIYGADGETLADAGTELRRTVLVTELAPGPGGTSYAATGDALAWILLVLGGLAILSAHARPSAALRRNARRGARASRPG